VAIRECQFFSGNEGFFFLTKVNWFYDFSIPTFLMMKKGGELEAEEFGPSIPKL
jgi:hypothetical protein